MQINQSIYIYISVGQHSANSQQIVDQVWIRYWLNLKVSTEYWDVDWVKETRLIQSINIYCTHSFFRKKKVTKFNAIDWSIIKSLVVSFRSPRHSLFSLIPYYFHLPSSRNPSWSQPKPITHWETLGRRLGVCNHNYCLLIKYKQTQLILSVNYFWVIFL